MKLSGFIIFFTIVLTIYSLINWYIFSRGLQALPMDGIYRTVYKSVLLFLILAYPAGRFLERIMNKTISGFVTHIGAYYLAMMLFAFFLILFIDLIRSGNYFFHYLPSSWYQTGSKAGIITFGLVAGSVVCLTIAGAWNAAHPRVREINIQLAKKAHLANNLKIVLASDIHLGGIINADKLKNIVNRINSLNPDIILLAGDIFDEDISSLLENNIDSILIKLKSNYGVYAIPGNHEYFSGIENAIAYLRQSNITVLRDSAVFVAGSFYLVGRDDRSANRFAKKRKPLAELMLTTNPDYPIILMDHQPFNLEEAQQNGVDLQLSGHTHHGQIFPFNFLTKKIYELSYGYLKKGNTHYYVSCGVGTWGPPVRLGSIPEIVKIELTTSDSLDFLPANNANDTNKPKI